MYAANENVISSPASHTASPFYPRPVDDQTSTPDFSHNPNALNKTLVLKVVLTPFQPNSQLLTKKPVTTTPHPGTPTREQDHSP